MSWRRLERGRVSAFEVDGSCGTVAQGSATLAPVRYRMGCLLRSRWRIGERSWPLVGLFTVLALFGHDALMASDTRAAETAVHQPASPQSRAQSPCATSAQPMVAAPERCGAARLIAPQVGRAPRLDLFSVDAVWGSSLAGVGDLAGIGPPRGRSLGPTQPPERRRAMLQIFLI